MMLVLLVHWLQFLGILDSTKGHYLHQHILKDRQGIATAAGGHQRPYRGCMSPPVAYCSCKLVHIIRLEAGETHGSHCSAERSLLVECHAVSVYMEVRQGTVNFHEHSTACCRALGRSGSDVHSWPAAMILTTSGTCKGVERLCMCLRPS
jgi:hypothetical protein